MQTIALDASRLVLLTKHHFMVRSVLALRREVESGISEETVDEGKFGAFPTSF